MENPYQLEIPEDFAGHSRVWIYQSNRPLREHEILEMNEQLQIFICNG